MMPTISALSSGLTPGSASSALNGNASSSNATGTNLSNALSGGTGSASSTVGDSTSDALQEISDAIAQLGAQARGDVQEFEKTTQDVLYDNNATGRTIGQLRLNSTRLNVISALSANEKVDTFTFNAPNSGTTKLSLLVNDPSAEDPTKDSSGKLRIQLFLRGKGMVADSDPSAGEYHDNFLALKAAKFDLKAGQYTIRVTRADDVDRQAKNTYNYALQLSQGAKYTEDYTVVERAYTPGTDDPFGLANYGDNAANILGDSMMDASSFISKLPPIGTSATSKLIGFVNSLVV